MSSIFVHGRLHAPFFVFLRAAGGLSDAELLSHFGLPDYRRVPEAPHLGRCAIFADDGQWTMLADDWWYTLWRLPTTQPAMAALAQRCDLFACSVGDCDVSFDFVYYRDSQLVRKYVFAARAFQHGHVAENIGPPLPGEPAAFAHADELQRVLAVAASLGIKTDHQADDLRIYAPDPNR